MNQFESNNWRLRTIQILTKNQVMIQRQLYQFITDEGYKISYQKFNKFLDNEKMFKRKRLFDASKVLIVMMKGASFSRLQINEYILFNEYLLKYRQREGYLFYKDYVEPLIKIKDRLTNTGQLSRIQQYKIEEEVRLHQIFAESRKAQLRKEGVQCKDETLLHSLLSRGVKLHGVGKEKLIFVVADKRNSLSVGKIVSIAIDLQEEFNVRMGLNMEAEVRAICLTEARSEKLVKDCKVNYASAYLKQMRIKRLPVAYRPQLRIVNGGIDKYVQNIERYIIA